MKITDTHVYFWGGPFSNWAMTPFTYGIEPGIEYNCAEQYMMHMKALVQNDFDTARAVLEARTPDVQKRLGRQIKNFDAKIWSEVNMQLMVPALVAKFKSTIELETIIRLSYPRTIVEASPYDDIWGVGLSEQDPRILDEASWRGENRLGKVLMQAREIIMQDHP